MTSRGYIHNAAIGRIAFQQADCEAFGFTAGEWEERSVELFNEYECTKNLTWIPGYSEIWIADMDQPIDRDTDHEEFARECMDAAFELMSKEREHA
jgi:hypothetical protein